MQGHVLPLITFAGVASALAAVFLAGRDLFSRRRDRDQLQDLVRRIPPETPEKTGLVNRFDHWFERTLYLSGLNLGVAAATMLLLLLALTAGGAIFLLTEDLLPASGAGFAAVGGVLLYVTLAMRRRQRKFEQQFPQALDLLARAVRAGESLDQAVELVGKSSPEPVATEFRRIHGQLEMGLSLSAAMRSLNHRLGLIDVRIFATTLSVHRDAGGNLPETLERLAAVIRDRMAYQRHVKSVTGAGRFSSMVIAALGPVLFAYLFFFQPEYGRGMIEDTLGRTLVVSAFVLEGIGIAWVLTLLRSDY